MGTARGDHTATLLRSGKVLVAGGFWRYHGLFSSAELYDPTSGTWTATDSMRQKRAFSTATLLPRGWVLVAGGYALGSALSDAERYVPASGLWRATGPLGTGRFGHTATLLGSGQVLVAGGYNNGYLSSAELYERAAQSWTSTNKH